MNSTHNKGKSVVAERFIRALKSKKNKKIEIYDFNRKMCILISYLIWLIITTVHFAQENMKPVDVKSGIYIDFKKENNKDDHKLEVGEQVKILKYKNIFTKGYVPNWFREIFVIRKVKNTVPWTYLISDLNGKEIVGTFYEK